MILPTGKLPGHVQRYIVLSRRLFSFFNQLLRRNPPVDSVDFESNMALRGKRPGLLLVGHGTRDARGVSEFLSLADQVAGRLPNVLVRPGFLELAVPSIRDAVEDIGSGDVDVMVVVPALLFAAGHAKRDIPRAVDDALGQLQLPCVQAQHFGTHEQLIALSHRRFLDATSHLPSIPDDLTMLLLIGRGSRDEDAKAEMLEVSRLRQQLSGVRHVTTSFFAMSDPGLEVTIADLQQRPFRRIVVQPHLLFYGQIMAQIADMVTAANLQSSDQEWVGCEHLGPSSGLAQVVVNRFMQALTL